MNKKITVLGGLLMAVVMTAYSVSGTYAKYTSTFTGSDSARVAKWAFKIGDITDTSAENAGTTFTFDLFKTINDTKDGNKETDVKDGQANLAEGATGENIIAPGTQGSFTVALQNLSEVTAKYSLELTETNAGNVPIEYSIDNGATWIIATEVDGVRTIAFTGITDETLIMNAGADTTKTIQWRWAFEGKDSENYTTGDNAQTDATDTTLGIGGTATVTVDAKVIVTQVD